MSRNYIVLWDIMESRVIDYKVRKAELRDVWVDMKEYLVFETWIFEK